MAVNQKNSTGNWHTHAENGSVFIRQWWSEDIMFTNRFGMLLSMAKTLSALERLVMSMSAVAIDKTFVCQEDFLEGGKEWYHYNWNFTLSNLVVELF